MNHVSRSVVCLMFAMSVFGCYSTSIKSGLTPASAPTVENDEKWHSGLVAGIAEVSGPYDLKELCPTGWARIDTETSFANGLVQLVTSGIYNPQTVTVTCAAGPTRSASAVQRTASARSVP